MPQQSWSLLPKGMDAHVDEVVPARSPWTARRSPLVVAAVLATCALAVGACLAVTWPATSHKGERLYVHPVFMQASESGNSSVYNSTGGDSLNVSDSSAQKNTELSVNSSGNSSTGGDSLNVPDSSAQKDTELSVTSSGNSSTGRDSLNVSDNIAQSDTKLPVETGQVVWTATESGWELTETVNKGGPGNLGYTGIGQPVPIGIGGSEAPNLTDATHTELTTRNESKNGSTNESL